MSFGGETETPSRVDRAPLGRVDREVCQYRFNIDGEVLGGGFVWHHRHAFFGAVISHQPRIVYKENMERLGTVP